MAEMGLKKQNKVLPSAQCTNDLGPTRSKWFWSKKGTNTVCRRQVADRTEKRPKRSWAFQKLEVNRVRTNLIYMETLRILDNYIALLVL